MLTLLKVYRTDANTFTEIYGKLKAADTQEIADFIIKSKKTFIRKVLLVLFVRKLALKLTLSSN